MKEKTSITLSRDILSQIDKIAGSRSSRSALIEQVLRQYLGERQKAAIYAKDLEILNKAADRLNAEAEDALDYQAPLE